MRTVGQRDGVKPRGVGPLLASTAVSITGDGALLAAAPLLAASMTRNPVAVSTVTAAFYLPWLLAGLPAGALVDRWARRPVMVAADIVRAVILTTLAALVFTGTANLPFLVATVLLVGVAQCFFDSAAQAMIPAIVGRDKEALTRTNGRFWALDTVGRSLIGPPLGSTSFALNKGLPFIGDALSFLVSAALVSRLPQVPAPKGPHESVTAAIRSGMQHLIRTRDLRVLALSLGAYNFGYNLAIATFVLYAKEVLGVADAGYGVLLAAMAIGGVLAGWRAAPITRRLSYRQVQAIAHLIQGLAWVGVALTTNAVMVGILFVFLGAGSSLVSVAVGSARQALTPNELLGRVVSAFRLIGLGAAGLGALVGGVVAEWQGLRAPMAVAATLLILAVLPTWSREPATS
jgi:MFS family permease